LADRLWPIEREFAHLPRQLVHGDFWDNNIYFRDGEIVLVGDFDFAGERPRIDDLALTLFYASELFDRPAEPVQLRELAERYSAATAAPLTAIEWAALPFAIARSPLCFIGHLPYNSTAHSRAELVNDRGPQCEWALQAVKSSRWLDTFRQDTVDGAKTHR
jgi:Ser/Thr protein kinase RdoA (MazF antagonist)